MKESNKKIKNNILNSNMNINQFNNKEIDINQYIPQKYNIMNDTNSWNNNIIKKDSISNSNKYSNKSNSRNSYYYTNDKHKNTTNTPQKLVKLNRVDFNNANSHQVAMNNLDQNDKKLYKEKNDSTYNDNNVLTEASNIGMNEENFYNYFSPKKNRSSKSTEKKNRSYNNFYQNADNRTPSRNNIKNYNKINIQQQHQQQNYYNNNNIKNIKNNILNKTNEIFKYFNKLNQFKNFLINQYKNVYDNTLSEMKNALIVFITSVISTNDPYIFNNEFKNELFSLIQQNDSVDDTSSYEFSRPKTTSTHSYSNIEMNNEYLKQTIDKLTNDIKHLKLNNNNIMKKNKILNQKLILKEKEINNLNNKYKGILNKEENNINKTTNNNEDINNYIIIQKNNEIQKLHNLLDEKVITNNKLKDNINKLQEEISSMKDNNKINLSLVNQKSSQINDLNDIINKLKTEINEINKEKVILENDLIVTKKDIINQNDIIDSLNDKCKELRNDINKKQRLINEYGIEINNYNDKNKDLEEKNKKINIEKDNLIVKIEEQNQKINNLDSIINELNKKINNYKNKEDIIINDDNQIINNNNNIENESHKNNDFTIKNLKNNNDSIDSIKILEKKINNKRPSTPSFKSLDSKDDNLENNDLKKLNDLLLKKIKEYESMLNIDEKKRYDINNIDINNNNIKINDINDINNEKNDIKYYQDKYIHYLQLYQEYKNKYEFSQVEIDTLNERLKNNDNNNDNHNNNICHNNNMITTFSSIKINNQYHPEEYFILCDKKYKEFKWYLMKKQSEYEENDNYDNLVWVSSLDVDDIDKFNEYSNEDDSEHIEMLNIIKKLEEKENIISKLTFKLEKLEKELELKNFHEMYKDELFIENKNNINNDKKKNKSKNKIMKYFKTSENEDNKFNENKSEIAFGKELSDRVIEKKRKNSLAKSTKEQKEENAVPMQQFKILLEKLNQSEAEFAKLQKENMELKKNKKYYLNQNNNIVNIIPNNDIEKEKNESDNNCIINFSSDINKLTLMGNHFINNINDDGLGLLNNKNIKNNNKNDENETYKIKYINLEKKVEMQKKACKKILIKLKVPKKEKDEIKQILLVFEFNEDDLLEIFGEKKNKNSKK